jgi:Na+/melibiose symporter-like transporter
MDIESCSLVVLVSINLIVFIGVILFLAFFYKWDNKTYDDMVENLDNYRRAGFGNELYLGEGASNIESLLAKEDTVGQYTIN